MTKTNYIPEGSTQLQEKFINCMMKCGKKSISRSIFGNTMKILRDQGIKNPSEIFEKAVKNVMPTIEVRARRVGGSVYQIPVEVKYNRQVALSIRWLIGACRSKKGKAMPDKLAFELLEASKEQGNAFKKREDVHRMAAANKAFAHLGRYNQKG